MSDATTPVIVSACRTPIGKYLGGLSSFTAPQLGAIVLREAIRRAGADPALVDEVIMGHVLQGGAGQAPGRQAAIHSGLPATIPAVTINKVCGSGLKAVMLAAQAIKAGDAQCVVAGGMEAMSASPHYLYGLRTGIKAGNSTLVDGMIHDGLWDSFGTVHMGSYAEYTAEKAGITRKDQDEFAYQSHRKAVAAIEAGRFKAEIVPVEVPGKGGPTVVDTDEGPRKDTTPEVLAKLKPAFQKEGTVTAGNAPGLNDGASALVVTSLAFARTHRLTPARADYVLRDRWRRTPRSLLRPDPGGGEPAPDRAQADLRIRSHRGERGLRGPGPCRWPRAGLGLGPCQCERRGHRPGSPDRRERGAGPDHAALRHAGPEGSHRPRDVVSGRRQRRGPRGRGALTGKDKLKLLGWSSIFLVGAFVLSGFLAFLLARVVLQPGASFLEIAAVQTIALLIGFGFATWLIGHRVLKLTRADFERLGGARAGRRLGRFGRGMLLGIILAAIAMLIAVPIGHASWRTDSAGPITWIGAIALTGVVLLPAALAEELAFRGVPLLALTRAFGRGPAIAGLAVLFAAAHLENPSVSILALANIALAGVFLALLFFTPGGLWTSTGAHLGWNLTLAGLGAPVSGLPLAIPWLGYSPGGPLWLTGGAFGPEGGAIASLCLLGGSLLAARTGLRKAEAS